MSKADDNYLERKIASRRQLSELCDSIHYAEYYVSHGEPEKASKILGKLQQDLDAHTCGFHWNFGKEKREVKEQLYKMPKNLDKEEK